MNKPKYDAENIEKSPYILVIGGANIDIEGYPLKKLHRRSSNPGNIKKNFGGVGRNIAENLAALDVNVKFMSLVGNDIDGTNLLNHCKEKGIHVENMEVIKNKSTSTYLSILDENMDMEMAISCMDIMDEMDEEFIKRKKELIEKATFCVIDTNLPQKTIEFLLSSFHIPFIVDTVSLEKSKKIEGFYHLIDTLKPNLIEAEWISQMKIKTKEDIIKAAKKIHRLGVKNIFISLGENGVYYKGSNEEGFIKPPNVNIQSSTGAGDAFISAVTLGKWQKKSLKEQAIYGIANSLLSLESQKNIPENLSPKKLKEKQKKVEKWNLAKNI